ncbi:hypothetical protein PDE_00193 [Penicillium oxalicum 114-2]|uniref:3-hydroxyacyl-CoA dehydrogenase NAD binding domain-containing protein n=1 Tax=Penicillium oxalicum (strain 114-2 / CGMCC 5302) TaxID=933388 RepID=S7Z408_PENO1|nr:hypothetical protein PDE_00193 [Penicillium oxalicum 114-2]
MSDNYAHHIALLGAGTIGLSMAAMHLRRPDTCITIFDPRPDAEDHLCTQLPSFLDLTETETEAGNVDGGSKTSNTPSGHTLQLLSKGTRLRLASSIQDAVQRATIVQEQTPELLSSKQSLWLEVSRYVTPTAHLWSSSSGIPASAQAETCPPDLQARLLVVHPFNPPHLMPLVEIVPGPSTSADRVSFVQEYFTGIPAPASARANQSSPAYYRPVVLQKEIPGFVGNRLAFALLREACHLVSEGVVTARDLDAIVLSSLGPRWAGSGVFESYHAGGGPGGIGAFLDKLAPTIQEVWSQLGTPVILAEGSRAELHDRGGEQGDPRESWRQMVVTQTEEAYGPGMSADTRARKEQMLKGVLELQRQVGEEEP